MKQNVLYDKYKSQSYIFKEMSEENYSKDEILKVIHLPPKIVEIYLNNYFYEEEL
jgi:hypothetical protein